jgi:uncharacterized membrane protein YfcA
VELSVVAAVAVVCAGFVAGAINALAGGGTLVALPVLIWLGVPPWSANIACTVGLLPGYAGGALAYRQELAQTSAYRRPLLITATVGGVVGAGLLLVTPPRAFELIVPFLVLGSVLLLIARPTLARLVAQRGHPHPTTGRLALGLLVSMFACGVYGAYFGAALGVLLLAALGIYLQTTMQVQNALKSVLSFGCVAAGAVIYIVLGEVEWVPALLLLVASMAGGFVGGRLGRGLPDEVLRRTVIGIGLVVSAALMISTYA